MPNKSSRTSARRKRSTATAPSDASDRTARTMELIRTAYSHNKKKPWQATEAAREAVEELRTKYAKELLSRARAGGEDEKSDLAIAFMEWTKAYVLWSIRSSPDMIAIHGDELIATAYGGLAKAIKRLVARKRPIAAAAMPADFKTSIKRALFEYDPDLVGPKEETRRKWHAKGQPQPKRLKHNSLDYISLRVTNDQEPEDHIERPLMPKDNDAYDSRGIVVRTMNAYDIIDTHDSGANTLETIRECCKTERERNIIDRLEFGLTVEEVADELGWSVRTIWEDRDRVGKRYDIYVGRRSAKTTRKPKTAIDPKPPRLPAGRQVNRLNNYYLSPSPRTRKQTTAKAVKNEGVLMVGNN